MGSSISTVSRDTELSSASLGSIFHENHKGYKGISFCKILKKVKNEIGVGGSGHLRPVGSFSL